MSPLSQTNDLAFNEEQILKENVRLLERWEMRKKPAAAPSETAANLLITEIPKLNLGLKNASNLESYIVSSGKDQLKFLREKELHEKMREMDADPSKKVTRTINKSNTLLDLKTFQILDATVVGSHRKNTELVIKIEKELMTELRALEVRNDVDARKTELKQLLLANGNICIEIKDSTNVSLPPILVRN